MYSHEDATQPRDRRAWTDDEDELLRRAIDKGPSSAFLMLPPLHIVLTCTPEDGDANPPSKWHAIAKHIPNRTNKDCRKRWWAQMATRVSKGSWSAEEDERLFSAVDELGTKWAAVASRVGTRNSGRKCIILCCPRSLLTYCFARNRMCKAVERRPQPRHRPQRLDTRRGQFQGSPSLITEHRWLTRSAFPSGSAIAQGGRIPGPLLGEHR